MKVIDIPTGANFTFSFDVSIAPGAGVIVVGEGISTGGSYTTSGSYSLNGTGIAGPERIGFFMGPGSTLHVDNVKVTYETPSTANFLADIRQATDYSPFGVKLKNRDLKLTPGYGLITSYRYGFNGMEGDDEIKGVGNSYDFGARMLDSRIGRWLTIDPLYKKQPSLTPYETCLNSPLNVVDPDGRDDYFINISTGEIQVLKTDCTYDTFFVGESFDDALAEVLRLEKNEYGLVNFPDEHAGLGSTRYGGIQEPGFRTGYKNKKYFEEEVGSGDHYLKPETAAGLVGLLYVARREGISICMGDMSASNGSDPGTATFHHGGHGHTGKRSGLDIDFLYIDPNGKSRGMQMTDATFSQEKNQRFYELAYLFGFDKKNTYQGETGSLVGVKKMDGHEGHGHLGMHHKFKNFTVIGNANEGTCNDQIIIEEQEEICE